MVEFFKNEIIGSKALWRGSMIATTLLYLRIHSDMSKVMAEASVRVDMFMNMQSFDDDKDEWF